MWLIDADALLRKLCAERDEVQIEHACDIGYHNGLNMAASMTINAPTIDPESLRPQGEWERVYEECVGWVDRCSECKTIGEGGIYCTECGAFLKRKRSGNVGCC